MEDRTRVQSIQTIITCSYVAFVVLHYASRLAYGPFQFWVLDIMVLMALLPNVLRMAQAKAFSASLKEVSQRKSFRYVVLLHAVFGVITGSLIAASQAA